MLCGQSYAAFSQRRELDAHEKVVDLPGEADADVRLCTGGITFYEEFRPIRSNVCTF